MKGATMKGLAVIASVALLMGSAATARSAQADKEGAPEPAPRGATSLALASGQTAVFEVHEDRTLKVLKVEPITPDRLYRFRPGRDLVSTAATGQVVITLLYDPRIGTLMKVENSGDFSFDYSATVTGLDKSGGAYRAPVDLCPAVKGAAFYEIWDHPISMIHLSSFDRRDKPPPCPGPKAKPEPKGQDV
jgi:hypothetical protein